MLRLDLPELHLPDRSLPLARAGQDRSTHVWVLDTPDGPVPGILQPWRQRDVVVDLDERRRRREAAAQMAAVDRVTVVIEGDFRSLLEPVGDGLVIRHALVQDADGWMSMQRVVYRESGKPPWEVPGPWDPEHLAARPGRSVKHPRDPRCR